jgi:hypothetical protein
MNRIENKNYQITHDPPNGYITFTGILRPFTPAEADAVTQLLSDVAACNSSIITLDLRPLQYLNSSGLNLLSRFIIKMRGQTTRKVVVKGSEHISWQKKSLKNFQSLMPRLTLEWE